MSITGEVCRLCLSSKNFMFPIFRNRIFSGETSFRTKIMSCTSIEVFADEELPLKICYICAHQVEKFFQFQTMCKKSESVLNLQMKETKVFHEVKEDKNSDFVQEANIEMKKDNSMFNCLISKCNVKKSTFDILSCNICSLIFETSNLLIEHLIKSHPDLNTFVCKNCKATFSNLNQFKNHLNFQHSLSCDQCDCVFKQEKNLKDHLKLHLGEHLTCKLCGQFFINFSDLKNHKIVHSEKTCKFCNKELGSKNEFESHLKNCKQKYDCKFCKKAFEFKKELITHVNSFHDSYVFEKCNSVQSTVASNQEHHCDNENHCTHCQTQSEDDLSEINESGTDYSKDMLICKFCAKKFTLRSSLKRHEKSHSGLKPYQCKYCPRKFKDSSACVVHTRTHTGEHPFRCEECHKDFKQLANLKMHVYRHHKKNKKFSELKPEILNENQHDYEDLYSGNVIEHYSGENIKSFQDLNESMSDSFNGGLNILMPDQHSS